MNDNIQYPDYWEMYMGRVCGVSQTEICECKSRENEDNCKDMRRVEGVIYNETFMTIEKAESIKNS